MQVNGQISITKVTLVKHSRKCHAETQRIERGAQASWASVQLSSENMEYFVGEPSVKSCSSGKEFVFCRWGGVNREDIITVVGN